MMQQTNSNVCLNDYGTGVVRMSSTAGASTPGARSQGYLTRLVTAGDTVELNVEKEKLKKRIAEEAS